MNEFEARLEIIKHFSHLLLEMGDFDFEKMSPEEEAEWLADYEDVATHLLDSISLRITNVGENKSLTAEISITPYKEYIEKIIAEEEGE